MLVLVLVLVLVHSSPRSVLLCWDTCSRGSSREAAKPRSREEKRKSFVFSVQFSLGEPWAGAHGCRGFRSSCIPARRLSCIGPLQVICLTGSREAAKGNTEGRFEPRMDTNGGGMHVARAFQPEFCPAGALGGHLQSWELTRSREAAKGNAKVLCLLFVGH